MLRWCAGPRSSPTSSLAESGISRASRRAPRSPDLRVSRPHAVDAPRARSCRCKIQEDEAEQDRCFTLVDQWPEAMREMTGEVTDRHFARRDECGEAGEQPKCNQNSGDQLNH